MRVVIDTNVLIASLGKTSPYRKIFDGFLDKKFQLIISNDILLEYLEVLTNKTSFSIADKFIETFSSAVNTIRSEVFYYWYLIKVDPDDNKFCDLFVSSNADYLVTNDKHFDVVKTVSFPPVKVISADDFINILNSI